MDAASKLTFFFFGCVCASRWEQPAQFVVPWVALEDQNVRQWTDQWTLSATRLRQLQMNHWKTDRQTLFVTLQVMTTSIIIYTCHASDTIDNYSHSFSQFPRSIRPGDITGTCVWQISSGDLTLYSTHNVNLDDAAVRLKQIRGLRLFPFELRNKRLQRKLPRLKTLSRKACLKANLKLKIVVCDLRIFFFGDITNSVCLFFLRFSCQCTLQLAPEVICSKSDLWGNPLLLLHDLLPLQLFRIFKSLDFDEGETVVNWEISRVMLKSTETQPSRNEEWGGGRGAIQIKCQPDSPTHSARPVIPSDSA